MNRVKRDYCSKGYHPRWQAWSAAYGVTGQYWDMNGKYPVTNGFLGNFCQFCGDRVTDARAWGHGQA